MSLAPVGYVNKTDDAGRKFIAPDGVQSEIIKWSYEEIAKGIYNTEQIYKQAKARGFKKTRALFWFAIRNPVYCGKIFIPKYKEDESRFVKGQHKPIISEELYYHAQDVLDGRKRGQYRLKVVSNESLPLRGFLLCPDCGKILTGSASKGHTKHYAYYHCFGGCKFRHRADDANEQFLCLMRKFVPRSEMLELYKLVLEEAWHSQHADHDADKKQLIRDIKEAENKIAYLRELLLSRQIEPDDFRDMKAEYSIKLEKLEAKLSGYNNDTANIKDLLDKGLNVLLGLDYAYENAEIDKKRDIISSMFPEKLRFENNAVRTVKVNEAVNYIYLVYSFLEGKKKRTEWIYFHSVQSSRDD